MSIWRSHFSSFTPILDFTHAIQYAYAAADAWKTDGPALWTRYPQLAEAIGEGRVADVTASLRAELSRRGVGDEDVPEESPMRPLVDALRYFTNNRQRMDYPTYRRKGRPITSSPMESLIKQINHRVKGTEMFWLQPDGAEAILADPRRELERRWSPPRLPTAPSGIRLHPPPTAYCRNIC